MINKKIVVTCHVCSSVATRETRSGLHGWISHLPVGKNNAFGCAEMWFCSERCHQSFFQSVTPDMRSVVPMQILTITTCDCCDQSITQDANSPEVGGLPLEGWIDIEVTERFSDSRRTKFKICSTACLPRLREIIDQPFSAD